MNFKQNEYKLDSYKLDYEKDDIEYKSNYLEKLNNTKKISLSTLILEKIEHYQQKLVLEKIKEILINESRKGYYRNAANVKEIIELEKKDYIDKHNQIYLDTTIMQIYDNDYYEFFTIRRLKENTKTLKK